MSKATGVRHWAYSEQKDEVIKKVSLKTKGRHLSPTTEFKKGHVMSLETRQKISKTMRGMRANNKGVPHKEEHKEKISRRMKEMRDKLWSWKGGITPINKLLRRSKEYRDWKNCVFARDDYECQICGCRGGKLNANHIKKFSDYVELRFSEQNGITLCKNCHFSLVNGKETQWESYFNFNLETRGFIYDKA